MGRARAKAITLWAAMIFGAVQFGKPVHAQQVTLPAPLNSLFSSGRYVEVGGVRFSDFGIGTVLEGGLADGVAIANAVVVQGAAAPGIAGLDFVFAEPLAVQGALGSLRGVLGFDATAPLNGTLLKSRLVMDAEVVGPTVASVGGTVSDRSHPLVNQQNLRLSVGFEIGETLADQASFTPSSIPVSPIAITLGLGVYTLESSAHATIRKVSFRVSTGDTILAGDFDWNGRVDGADLLLWQRQVGSNTDIEADGNGNGIVDAADLAIWRNNFGRGARPPGDFDGDGDVDGADMLLWQRALGTNNPAVDASGNGIVDGADLAIWQSSFGGGIDSVLASVPEPSTGFLVIVGLGLACLLARSRR